MCLHLRLLKCLVRQFKNASTSATPKLIHVTILPKTKDKIAIALRTDSFKKRGTKSVLRRSFRCNFVSGEKGKKGKRNMGKVGPLPQLGYKQMKRALFTYWDTKKKRV